jgi:hypothetical protein
MLDFIISELQDRYINHRALLLTFRAFLPIHCCTSDFHGLVDVLHRYEVDLTLSAQQVDGEFALWQDTWRNVDAEKCPSTPTEALAACDRSFFPNVHRMLQLFATLPVSTATAERSFSTLRRLKTYLRNTTSDNRLNGLALLNIHRDVQVSPELVIDRFASNKIRRLQFVLN